MMRCLLHVTACFISEITFSRIQLNFCTVIFITASLLEQNIIKYINSTLKTFKKNNIRYLIFPQQYLSDVKVNIGTNIVPFKISQNVCFLKFIQDLCESLYNFIVYCFKKISHFRFDVFKFYAIDSREHKG